MSMVPSAGSRAATGHGRPSRVPFTHEFTKMLTKGSPRFGSLSHHSFFSRHNPHPHRVRHIQGLNGGAVCAVRDDWFVTSSLFPHPLLKSHVLKKAADTSLVFPPGHNPNGTRSNENTSARFSEAWRDELKELAAKVSLSSQAQKDNKEDHPEEEFARRKTQYSASSGRIIPPSTKRRSRSQPLVYPQLFHDQELTVLELLCQILQTDSLSAVQRWLLLAGQREKDLVMGMIKQALDGVDFSGRQLRAFHPAASPPACAPSLDQGWRKPRGMCSHRTAQTFSEERPERIGEAEVLEVHTEVCNPS
ncbi:protein TBATA [Echeneis naucrates]|uniref:protein TBATA n=1 Tax=Echeneis naucrates TaxID=173247 RepID=UPI001114687A|nr:protein TBATA [Echeneis naucrates]